MARKKQWQGGQYHHNKGTSGISVLEAGLIRRASKVDPVVRVEVHPPKTQRRKVRLRKEPVDE